MFDGYRYQDRAKELANQLPKRMEEFNTMRLATDVEWKSMAQKATRAVQIKFLAEHLRLLNCIQTSQPGDVNLSDEQTAVPYNSIKVRSPDDWEKVPKVINPYAVLRSMRLEIKELPILVPYLLDETFIPTFSYWRTFHPDRHLYRVSDVTAMLLNDAAKRDLADMRGMADLDTDGRRKHVESIITWCHAHADQTREQLLLQSLRTTDAWGQFNRSASEMVVDHNAKALPILVKRQGDFPDFRDEIAELCYALNTADAVAPARKWIKDKDPNVQLWGGLILLQHGKPHQLRPAPDPLQRSRARIDAP